MTSEAKIEANRRNARKSTGPRTDAGKALARYNAVRHGVLTAAPLLPGEDIAAWDQHNVGVAASLAPVGALEQALAERVALTLWRLGRFARAEALAAAADLADAVLPKVPALPTDISLPRHDLALLAVKAAGRKLAKLKARHARAQRAGRCLEALPGSADGEALPDAPEAVRAARSVAGRFEWKGPKSPRDPRELAHLAAGETWSAGHLRRVLRARRGRRRHGGQVRRRGAQAAAPPGGGAGGGLGGRAGDVRGAGRAGQDHFGAQGGGAVAPRRPGRPDDPLRVALAEAADDDAARTGAVAGAAGRAGRGATDGGGCNNDRPCP